MERRFLGQMPIAKMKNSVKENYDAAKPQGRSVCDLNKGKQAEPLDYVSSSCISSRSRCWQTLTKETELPAKASSIPSMKGQSRKTGGMKDATIEHEVDVFPNQDIASGNFNERLRGLGWKGKTGKGGNSEREGDFTFATAHDGLASSIVATGDKTEEKRTETLRVKLWETLGTFLHLKPNPLILRLVMWGQILPNQFKALRRMMRFSNPGSLDTIETDSEDTNYTFISEK